MLDHSVGNGFERGREAGIGEKGDLCGILCQSNVEQDKKEQKEGCSDKENVCCVLCG